MANKDLTSDQRFSRVTKDPRFWEMPEKEKKIKIDKRFQAMFHDKKFNLKYTVDKRGRPMSHNTTEDLKRYYDLSDSDEDLLAEEETALDAKKEKKKKAKQKQQDEPKSKETAAKISKERKEAEASEEMDKSKEAKKVKAKGNSLSKQKNDEKVKTTEKPSTSFPQKSDKKSVKVMEQEDSEEESGLEDESDQYSNDEPNSDEEMSSMELKEDEESDDGNEDDDSEEEESEESEEDEGASSGEEEDSDIGPDLARGKGNIETSSEEEDDDEDEDEDDLARKQIEIEHSWREMDKDAPRGDEVTRRLAVCNMDWDRLKAKDLLALFNSFKPKGGIVFSVKIYPSEYGKEKLKEEELHGPTELKNISEDVAEDHLLYKEKLREYQFKRLKYYYAVVECDSPETAGKIYEECDGLEFETSCSFVDLRFIPDDVQFNDEPKDSAVDVDLSAYQPKFFTSAAMVTSKVELTWDETDQERVTSLNRPFKKNEVLDMDFKAYLASSSEEEEEEEIPQESEVSAKPDDTKSKKGPKDDDEQIERYRQLLKGIQEKEKLQQEKDVEMEVKWVPGLKESAEQMVKNKLEGKDKLTPWEKYLQKQKDKRKLKRKKKNAEESNDEDEIPSDVDFNDPFFSEELKNTGLPKKPAGGKRQKDQGSSADEEEREKQRAEMALLMMDDVEEDRKHFNYDKIVEQQNLSRSKKKKLKKKDKLVEDEFEINVEDSRFQAMYTSHLYNVDPSDPNFKKTKAMDKVLEEKARRREQEQKSYTETVKRQQEELKTGDKMETSTKKVVDPALSALLKSIKSKTQQFQASKKQKTK